MFRLLLICVVAGLGVLALMTFGVGTGPQQVRGPDPSSIDGVRTKANGVERVAFVDGIDLDDGAVHALILHPLATNGVMRVITDPDALRAAKGKAFYTDNPGEQTKMLVLSLLFLSPAGMSPDSQFATTVRNKEVVEHFRCYVPFCNGSSEADPPHERDFAGLLEASLPVEYLTERSRNPEDIRAFHFRALRDDRIVQIDPPDLPAPNTVIYSNRIILNLPPVLLESDEAEQEALIPFDEAEFKARFTAAFEHAYPQTEAYRLGEMRFSTYYPPVYGWPVVSDEIDGYLRDTNDNLRGIKRLIMKEPTISISLTAAMAADLIGQDAFADMPEFSSEPVSLPEQLDALALEVLGRPCPGCFKIELPVATVDGIKPREVKPTEYYLSYLRIMDE